ncbi:hypothetical protein HY416_04220 [Candidatus Kaiserbacteria bacterium]|nr:hypothetical protein [Candidatus Kaiserbacteria bacterium]
MENIIDSISKAIRDKNWYSALAVSLMIPDICTALEHERTNGGRYADWFQENLIQYDGFLSGNDCYALRCSLLHEARDDITTQRCRDVLERYLFTTSGLHLGLFTENYLNGERIPSILVLNVQHFCEDVCAAATKWLEANKRDAQIQTRLGQTIKIYRPGESYKGVIGF